MREELERHGKGYWRVRVLVGHNADGTKRYHTETIRGSKRQAQEALAEIRRRIRPSDEEYLRSLETARLAQARVQQPEVRQPEAPVVSPKSSTAPTLGFILVHPDLSRLEAIRSLIEDEPDLGVVVSAGTARESLTEVQLLRRKRDLVAVVSLELRGEQDVLWLIGQLRKTFPWVRIVAWGTLGDGSSISSALLAGADGFVSETAGRDAIVAGLRECAAGEMVLVGVPPSWQEPSVPGFPDALDPDS